MADPVWLESDDPDTPFPSPFLNYDNPAGLVAIGGDLSETRLLSAYQQGIFPWFEDGQPILWWSPEPRAVLFPAQLKISRSLKKTMRRGNYSISFNQDFPSVIRACAAPRTYSDATWITDTMRTAYCNLHRAGHAHSVEVWGEDGDLVAGLYGILLDHIFCGESMFHRKTDMSKIAMAALCQWLLDRGIGSIDCQIPNPHLSSLGATEIPKQIFLRKYLGLSPEDYPTPTDNQ